MFNTQLRYSGTATALGLLLLAVIASNARPAFAQSPSLLALLNQLQASVDAVQTSLDALSAPIEGNLRLTPPVVRFAGEEGVSRCAVTNVSSEPRNIRLESLGQTGAVVFSDEVVVQPGASWRLTVQNLEATRCRFTVLDGTRRDIVGSIVVSLPDGPVSLAAE